MLSQSQFDAVGVLLRRAAAEIVMPRFRSLAAGDVTEKTPGEVVTIADRAQLTIQTALRILHLLALGDVNKSYDDLGYCPALIPHQIRIH